MVLYRLNKLCHPEIFQGKYKRKRYFEGWYYKLTDSKGERTISVIPGVSIGEWDAHAFIQVIDQDNKVHYFRYDLNEFNYNEKLFEIMIGDNYFSKSRVRLNLVNHNLKIRGDLYFNNIMEFPKTCICLGVMGPFLYIPWMECYHDIISLQHDIAGHLLISDKKVEFSGGVGYIEKNWGKSMPSSWIWMQSNHFHPDDVSISLEIGKIPCLSGSFIGFIVLFRYKDRIFRFTTYSGARIRRLYYSSNKLKVTVQDCRFRLEMIVTHSEGGILKAPVNGRMSRDIVESNNAVVKVRFSDRKGNILYEGIGMNAGLEIVE